MTDAAGAADALILAGRRDGRPDPVAAAAGVAWKALAPAHGVPMLVRVVEALAACPAVGRVAVAGDRAALIAGDARLARRIGDGTLAVRTPAAGPSSSVAEALADQPAGRPLLVTTADHALLTPELVEAFLRAVPDDADVGVGLVAERALRAAYPEGRRTYYRFAGEGYSGANLFLMRPPRATNAAGFWRRMERHRKAPWRLVAAVGPPALGRFLMGRLTLAAAFEHLSGKADAVIRAVELPVAEAAIDVDKPEDLVLVEAILRGWAAEKIEPPT